MYQPTHGKFIELRPERWHRVIREYPLATLVTQSASGIDAHHVPFLLHEPNRLTAHVPRTNTVWQTIAERPVLAIFHGPDSYISPSWYPTKQEHGKVVPTWNYAIVHVRGTARAIEDRDWLRRHLEELTEKQEREMEHPWRVSDAPADYIDKMLGALVGIEIEITAIEGKFKLGQNRAQVDQDNVAREMAKRNPELEKLGQLVKEIQE
jgi:transcriptional regulator